MCGLTQRADCKGQESLRHKVEEEDEVGASLLSCARISTGQGTLQGGDQTAPGSLSRKGHVGHVEIERCVQLPELRG